MIKILIFFPFSVTWLFTSFLPKSEWKLWLENPVFSAHKKKTFSWVLRWRLCGQLLPAAGWRYFLAFNVHLTQCAPCIFCIVHSAFIKHTQRIKTLLDVLTCSSTPHQLPAAGTLCVCSFKNYLLLSLPLGWLTSVYPAIRWGWYWGCASVCWKPEENRSAAGTGKL